MSTKIEQHLTATAPDITAIDLLAQISALSRQQLKTAMANGAVWLETQHGINRIRRAKKRLSQGDIVHIYYDDAIQSQTPATATLIADESDFSVWNKAYGMYSQGSKWGDHCTIYRWAEKHLDPQRPAYLVHRLDRAANGLLILAHNKKTATAFMQMFKQHRITKHYHVYVEGDLSALECPFSIMEPLDDKQAETTILETSDVKDGQTVITVAIKTGRKHQIRRHLALLGHAVIGDRLYGTTDHKENLKLSSVFLGFDSPIDNTRKEYALPG